MRKPRQIIFTILLCIFGRGYAQFSPLWNASFQHTHTANFSNESRKVVQDATGNVFILADETSNVNGSGQVTTNTYHYVSVVKYNSIGMYQGKSDQSITNHIVSGVDNLSAFGLEVDASGNVYIGYALFTATNNFQVKIMKLDNNLVRIWTNSFGGTGIETGVDMKLHSSGTVYALIKSAVGANTYYKVIKSVPADGNASLVYIFTGNTDVLKSIAVDNNQNVYAAGYRLVSGFKSVLLISVSGTTNALRYASTYNGGISGDDYANMVTVGVDGNIYVIGTSTQGGGHGSDQVVLRHSSGITGSGWTWTTLQQNSTTDEGLFISAPEVNFLYVGMKTNNRVKIMRLRTSNGKISGGATALYQPLPGSPYNAVTGTTFNDMKVSANKNIYVTGSVLATNTTGQAFSSLFLSRFNFSSLDTTYSVGFSYLVAGTFTDNYKGVSLALDNTQTSVLWLRDYWNTNSTHAQEQVQLYNLDVPSTLREDQSNNESSSESLISIYPNPAKDAVKFVSKPDVQRVEIFDILGNRVADIHQISRDGNINVSKLKHGIYICRLTTSSGIVNKKLTIE